MVILIWKIIQEFEFLRDSEGLGLCVYNAEICKKLEGKHRTCITQTGERESDVKPRALLRERIFQMEFPTAIVSNSS